ncbi:MAG: hypothetical protein IJN29_14475 [Akkermansia sp.]|nr:hypothetical protein [Akkermansia sp.]
MKTINIIVAIAALVIPTLIAAPMPAKADLLASNTVVAVYTGTKERPCMFRTALCPDRCGHAAKVATFSVVSNEDYKKPGKYGDDKAEPGSVIMVDLLHETPGQSDEVKKIIETLQPGDAVRMTQDHYYGDFGEVVEPFRPVTKMEKLEGVKKSVPASTEVQHPIMPLRRAR